MQIDNNYNNYNNYNNRINFGAKRIMSATRMVDDAFEKFEVFKLDKSDIPFVRKLIEYMDTQKTKLDAAQKKLLKHFKSFAENRDYFEEPGMFAHKHYRKLYLGIKNDEQISGFMETSSTNVVGGKIHSISEICPNAEDKVVEDSFLYAFLGDKQLNGDLRSGFGLGVDKFGRAFSNVGRRKHIVERNPEYKFQTILGQNEKFDLEDVLGIRG